MKRLLVLLSLLGLALTMVFASYSYIGIGSGAEFYFNQTKLSEELSVGGSSFGVPMNIKGANYFGSSNDEFGIGYGVGAYFPINANMGSTELEDLAVSFRPSLSLRFIHMFNNVVNLETGLGYQFEWRYLDNVGESGSINTMIHSLTADIALSFSFSDMAIYVGSELSTPLYIEKLIESSGSLQLEQFGLAITPVIYIEMTY